MKKKKFHEGNDILNKLSSGFPLLSDPLQRDLTVFIIRCFIIINPLTTSGEKTICVYIIRLTLHQLTGNKQNVVCNNQLS